MGKIAFVFAGQGAQYTGMGRELYESSPAARAVYELCDRIRPGTSDLCFTGDKAALSVTENTQPAMFATDLACAQALRERGVQPAFRSARWRRPLSRKCSARRTRFGSSSAAAL